MHGKLMDMEGLTTSKLKLPQNVLGAGEIITSDNFSVFILAHSPKPGAYNKGIHCLYHPLVLRQG